MCCEQYHRFNVHAEPQRTTIINWSLFWEQLICNQVASEHIHTRGASNYYSALQSFCVTHIKSTLHSQVIHCTHSRYIAHTSNWLVHASVRSSFEYTSGVYRCIMHTHNHEYVLHLQYNKCSAVAPCSDTLGSQPGCIHVHDDEDTINQDDDSTGCIDHDITLWCHYLFHYMFICTIHSIIITFFLSQWSIKLLHSMTLPCFSDIGIHHLHHVT